MTRQQWEYFMVLCRVLNFSQTADYFYTKQPDVSKKISALEEELGLLLFKRGYRTVELTEAGEILYHCYLRRNGMLLEALDKARAVHEGSKGNISLGILEGLSIDILYCKFIEIQRRKVAVFKRIEYERPKELGMSIIEGHNDMILTLSNYIDNKTMLDSIKLTEVPLMLYYSVFYKDKTKNAIIDCNNMSLYYYDLELEPSILKDIDINREYLITKYGIKFDKIVQVNSFQSILSCVGAGLGVAILPKTNDYICNTHKVKCQYIGIDVDLVLAWRKKNKKIYINEIINFLLKHNEN